MISSLSYSECNRALERIVERMNLKKIYAMIDEIEVISDLRKEFYKVMYRERYEKILLSSYRQLKGEEGE